MLDKELPILRKTVQSFVKEHVGTAEFSQGIYAKDLPKEVAAFLKEKAKTIGFKSLGARKEWGGAGLSLYARTVIYEEAAQHRLGLYHPAADAFGEELPSFLETCTREQINTFVKPAIQEGKGCFIAVWEDLEGDRIKNITCTAVKNGDEWVINGEKSYIQKMDQAGFGVILVNCITEEGNKKPGLFLLNPDDPFEKNETVLIDVQKTHSISLNQFVIHDNRRIGEVGEGLILVKQWLAESQILLGARCLGVSAKAVEYAKSYAKLRITRGKPLSEFPTIRSMIANFLRKRKAIEEFSKL